MDSNKTHNPLISLLEHHSRGMVSIIGAGGKTSLMFALAFELVSAKKKVLTTTTTKIFYPSKEQCAQTLIEPRIPDLLKEAERILPENPHLAAGSAHDLETEKVHGFKPEQVDTIFKSGLFDWIIVEADGAKRKPAKATSSREPVIPCTTTHIVLVSGLDAVNQPLDNDHIHRPEIFSRNTGLGMEKPVSTQAMARNLLIETTKAAKQCPEARPILFLNKADSADRIDSGKEIIKIIREKHNHLTCVTGCLQPKIIINVSIEPFA